MEGHVCLDHVHMLIRIPPKFSVSSVVGYIKGKSAINIARRFQGRQRSYRGYHMWARGYFVSTVGINEEVIREYIRNQDKNDRQTDQNRLFFNSSAMSGTCPMSRVVSNARTSRSACALSRAIVEPTSSRINVARPANQTP